MSQSGLCYGDFETPQLIQKLQIEEHFFEFRDMFNARMREIEESMGHKVNSQDDKSVKDHEDADMAEDLFAGSEDGQETTLFDKLLNRCEQMVSDLSIKNKSELERQYSKFTNAYNKAESKADLIIQGKQSLVPRPSLPYNPTKLQEYGLDFLSYVDPYFVADIVENREWYLQKQNEVLLNVSYPSKQEKEFLRHIE